MKTFNLEKTHLGPALGVSLSMVLGLTAMAVHDSAGTVHGDSGANQAPPPPKFDGEVLQLTSEVSHPVLLAGAGREVFLHVGLQAAELPQAQRLGINLALVIDRSGSMGSEDKLIHAKAAAEQLVGRMHPDDLLSIVTYDDQVHTAMEATPVREAELFRHAIRSIESGNATNLHGGMLSGYEEVLKHFDSQRINRVLLLSDGLANQGVTEPFQIQARAEACRDKGVNISTMGLGLNYDEDLLAGIAHKAGGSYYYVGNAEDVGSHLDHELDKLTRIVARELEFHVQLADGVEVLDVFGYDYTRAGQELIIPTRDLSSGERRKMVMRLRIGGALGESRQLAATSLHYRRCDSETKTNAIATPNLIQFSDDPQLVQCSRSIPVLIQAEIVQNAVCMDEAMELQKAGQFDAAAAMLRARREQCLHQNAMLLHSPDLERMLKNMARIIEDIERTRHDRKASRDLQLGTELQAVGYLGG